MAHQPTPTATRHLPVPPIRRIVRPLTRFLQIESASGIVLLACTVVALVLANSPYEKQVHDFWEMPVRLDVGAFHVGGTLGHFVINDVLMTIFFFVVGLEIKRELVAGELRDPRKAALPVVAAIGGMLVPAGIYMALMARYVGQPEFRGWGVPMATDIAFVVGVMAILGRRVPFGLKIMILSLAIVDDIGAVMVIAVFYSGGVDWVALGMALLGFVLTYGLNRAGVRAISVYVAVGIGIWFAFHHSGVHPTMTGVLLGLLTPSREWVARESLRLSLLDLTAKLEADERTDPNELTVMTFAVRESVSPLERLETGLHPWVGFIVMPLFALANAGVHIDVGELTNPVAVAVALGLLLGKPIGIALFSFVAVRARIARLPEGVNWWVLLGGGCLAGIGFTMSLFVAGLAFEGHEQLLTAGKIGTLAGSVCSAVLGTGILLLSLRKRPTTVNGSV
ncbi:MAG TPA: Na+/H+ antiporter NhaA [Gemmata sp.]|nr:Na+/H+ antiporter NhaA [Gemmata sp.]